MPCQFCGYVKSKKTRFGNTCWLCFKSELGHKHEPQPKHGPMKVIATREEIINGQKVLVKVIEPGKAAGCTSGLRTAGPLPHVRVPNLAYENSRFLANKRT